MEKPKSFAYIIFCLTICLAFAIGSNYLINTTTQSNMIYNSTEPRKIGATYMTYNNTFYSVINEEISRILKEHRFGFSYEFKETKGTNSLFD